MSYLVEWIRYHMLGVSPNEVEYSIIFAYTCISTSHEICFLSIAMKTSSYDLIVLIHSYERILKYLKKSASNVA